jgi:hypothetical protein
VHDYEGRAQSKAGIDSASKKTRWKEEKKARQGERARKKKRR